jgi:hypothetical protein
MNRDTVLKTLDPLNPERDRVLVLAEEGGGVPIPVPEDFIPNKNILSDRTFAAFHFQYQLLLIPWPEL